MDLTQRILEIAPSMNKEVIDLLQGEIQGLRTFVQWGLGLCASGFIFSMGWIIKLQVQIKDRVTYQWMEEKFEKDLKADMEKVVNLLDKISVALLGDMNQPDGLLHKHNQLEKDVKKLKDKVYSK